MKLAIYKDVMTSGRGADRATGALANALAARGHEVHFLTQEPEDGRSLSVVFEPQVQLHLVAMPPRRGVRWRVNKWLLKGALGAKFLRRGLPGCDWVLQASRRLRAQLEVIRPDGIVSAGSNELIELCAEGRLPWPVVQMFHVYPPTCFAKNKEQRVARFKAALPMVAAVQVLMPSFKALIAPYTSAPVEVIGNAATFGPMPVADAPRQKQIIYVAYFTKDKNHEDLLAAFAQLKRAEDWTLELCGGGTRAWEARLRARVAALGIADRVHFHGEMRQIRPLLEQAAICAYPSRVEGFSLALLEAMGCGLACVGFKAAPGVNELIEPGHTGLLAAEGADAFAAVLQELVDDEALRMKLGRQAAAAVREVYSSGRIWRGWENFLAQTFLQA